MSVDKSIIEFGETVKDSIAEVRKFKSENNLSMRSEIDEAVINYRKAHFDRLKETEKDFIACTHVKKVSYKLI